MRGRKPADKEGTDAGQADYVGHTGQTGQEKNRIGKQTGAGREHPGWDRQADYPEHLPFAEKSVCRGKIRMIQKGREK